MRSSPLVVVLGAHRSMVVGARHRWVIVLGCSLWPWAVVAVAGFGVAGSSSFVGVRVCGGGWSVLACALIGGWWLLCPLAVGGGWWLLWAHRQLVVVVPVYGCGWLVVVVPVCGRGRLVVVVGGCVVVRSSWSWAIVAVRVRGRSLIIVVGGHYGQSLPFVVLPR